MYAKVNKNVEKMLEPVNLALEKVRAIKYIDSVKRELELAEKKLENIEDNIEKNADEIFEKSDKFSATFTGIGTESCDGKVKTTDLGEIGPFTSIKEFIDEYVYLMTEDKEAVIAIIKLNLNGDSITITANDQKLYEDKEVEAELEYFGFDD